MRIDEAVELLDQLRADAIEQLDPLFQDAIKQGIGALKRVKAKRLHFEVDINRLLPGETKD